MAIMEVLGSGGVRRGLTARSLVPLVQFYTSNGRAPSSEELAKATEVPKAKLELLLKTDRSPISLDKMRFAAGSDDRALIDTIPDSKLRPEEFFEARLRRQVTPSLWLAVEHLLQTPPSRLYHLNQSRILSDPQQQKLSCKASPFNVIQAIEASIRSLKPTEKKIILQLYPREAGGKRVRTREVAERMGCSAAKVSV